MQLISTSDCGVVLAGSEGIVPTRQMSEGKGRKDGEVSNGSSLGVPPSLNLIETKKQNSPIEPVSKSTTASAIRCYAHRVMAPGRRYHPHGRKSVFGVASAANRRLSYQCPPTPTNQRRDCCPRGPPLWGRRR